MSGSVSPGAFLGLPHNLSGNNALHVPAVVPDRQFSRGAAVVFRSDAREDALRDVSGGQLLLDVRGVVVEGGGEARAVVARSASATGGGSRKIRRCQGLALSEPVNQ